MSKAEIIKGARMLCPGCVVHQRIDHWKVVDERLQLFFRGSLEQSTIELYKTRIPMSEVCDFRKEVERLEAVAYYLEKFKGDIFNA